MLLKKIHLIPLLSLLFFTLPALASQPVPDDTCTTSRVIIRSGGPILSGDAHFMVCDGSNWISILSSEEDGRSHINIANDTGTCTSDKTGRLRYNDGTDTWEYCDGGSWGPFEQAAGGGSCNTTIITYSTPGIYAYSVPQACTSLKIEAFGAGGGFNIGGGGGGSIVLDASTVLVAGGGGGAAPTTVGAPPSETISVVSRT